MKRANKFGFIFNVSLSVFLIIQGILMFVSAIVFYLMGLLSIVFVIFLVLLGLAIHFCSFCYIFGGIINIVFVARNKTGNYSNLCMRLALILFNGAFLLYYFLFFLFELLFMSIQDAILLGMASPFFMGIYLIPTFFIAIVLLLIACVPNKKKTTSRNVLTLIASIFTLGNTVVIIYSYYYFPFQPYLLGGMGVLVLCFIVYLIIDLCRMRKLDKLDTTQDIKIDETTFKENNNFK